MVRVKFRFRFSGIGFLAFVTGSKWVRASARCSPLGSGVRQADSQTLCLPRRRSDGYFPKSVGDSCTAGGFAFSTAEIARFSEIPAHFGSTAAFSYWWGRCPTCSRKCPHTADSGFTAGSRWLPATCQCRRVTQGTQDFGGGFLRHLRHLRHCPSHRSSIGRSSQRVNEFQ